ncbi:squalene/phytoene synthase family protein [Acetobacter sp. AN02]|uniref:squalene/phytoene synthase family protein n=1 Tax=Acetobacter sp. AN02 TaxID=2894186 RepID=UPI0024341C16|nr:squalene/phytoene synthase family protein [Acetobacter sp. AN02]MDG6093539.1 squalene/phytoene synthase family protein [Acetobacter sp. AN02]
MTSGEFTDICQNIARLSDPDRFFCAMFLSEPARRGAFVLIAFNHEITRALAPAVSSEVAGPLAGYIRLQWWRDIIGGARFTHEVASPLSELLDGGQVSGRTLQGVLDAREAELSGLSDDEAWLRSMRCGPGGLQRAMGELCGVTDEATLAGLEAAGAAYGTGSLLRHLPAVLRSGRRALPERFSSGEATPEAASWLREQGKAFLRDATAAHGPAALPRVLARRDLKRKPVTGEAARGLGDRLALGFAGLRSRF